MSEHSLSERELGYWAEKFQFDIEDLADLLVRNPNYIRERLARDQVWEETQNERKHEVAKFESRIRDQHGIDLDLDSICMDNGTLETSQIAALLSEISLNDSEYVIAPVLSSLASPKAEGLASCFAMSVLRHEFRSATYDAASECLEVVATSSDLEDLVDHWVTSKNGIGGVARAIARLDPTRAETLFIDALTNKDEYYYWVAIDTLNKLKRRIPTSLAERLDKELRGDIRALLRRNRKLKQT